MTRSSKNIVINRTQVAQASGLIGAIFLLLGLIGYVGTGFLANYLIVILVLGVIGLILWAVLAPRDFTGFLTGRTVRFGTLTLFSTLLLVGCVVLVYGLLRNAAITLDMTETQRFTLSAESEQLLQRVVRPIRFTGFYTSANLDVREIDDQYFRLYEAATDGLITREFIDPEEAPAIAQTYGVNNDAQVFISYLNEDGTTDFNSLARVPLTVNQERELTNAIARLLVANTITVYFETSHGERDTLGGTADGLSSINAGLQETGFITMPLDLQTLASNNGDVPADAAAIFFVGPTTDLSQAEIDILDRYLNRGGSLFLMSDPQFNEDRFLAQNGLFNQYLWDHYGIRALDTAVVDPAVSGQTALDVYSSTVFIDSDIGARLDPSAGTATLFRLARGLEVNLESAPESIANGQVILSSPQSWGETNFELLSRTNTYQNDMNEDLQGQQSLVVWAYHSDTQAKIVLVGDSDFVTNGQVTSAAGNGILFTDSTTWLTNLSNTIGFAPQGFSTSLPFIGVPRQTIDMFAFLFVIVLPSVVFLTGAFIWARRSRA